MCTVSTSVAGSSFIVTMNRDERRIRLEGPLVSTEDFCYPTDAHAGGTWCGINRFGLIFCLLNRYDAPLSDAKSMISRGDIIPKALECQTIDEASDLIGDLELSRYNGFRLQIFSDSVCRQHDWDRSDHSSFEHAKPGDIFSSSSSLRSLSIPPEREHRYRVWQQQQELTSASDKRACGVIPAIHLTDPAVPPSDALFMVRKETHTKSICQLALCDGKAHLYYWPAQFGFDLARQEHWSAGLQVVDSPGVKSTKPSH